MIFIGLVYPDRVQFSTDFNGVQGTGSRRQRQRVAGGPMAQEVFAGKARKRVKRSNRYVLCGLERACSWVLEYASAGRVPGSVPSQHQPHDLLLLRNTDNKLSVPPFLGRRELK